MKRLFIVLSIILTGIIANAQKQVNTSKSLVTWKAYKVTGSHAGTVGIKSGKLDFNGTTLTGGEFVLDMTSIACTDLVAGQGKEKLEGHLKSEDFFGVAKYPEAKLVITKVVSRGKLNEYKIVGNLTIKSITKEIKFDAVVTDNLATTTLKIDRSDFDIKYGSGSFFDNLGDKTIYDEFDIVVKLVY